MTLKKANLNSPITSEIVNKAGILNTCIMDAIEIKEKEINIHVEECINIIKSIQALLTRVVLDGKYENEKTDLEIDTNKIVKELERFLSENN